MIDLPEDLRIHILGHLTIDDLAECAQVVTVLRNDCKHQSLSQIRTATINCVSGSTVNVLQAIRRMEDRGVFERLQRLKLNRPERLTEIGELDSLQAMNNKTIRGVKYLDFSCSSFSYIRPGVLEALQNNMPHASELSLSYCHLPPVALLNCINLQTLRWTNHRQSIPLQGVPLPFSDNLGELYMDDSTFQVYNETSANRMFNELPLHNDMWILIKFGKRLERVSIKNCRYKVLLKSSAQLDGARRIPQSALIKFVRNAPRLKWFSSDLTPENMAMLKAERPDITFE